MVIFQLFNLMKKIQNFNNNNVSIGINITRKKHNFSHDLLLYQMCMTYVIYFNSINNFNICTCVRVTQPMCSNYVSTFEVSNKF